MILYLQASILLLCAALIGFLVYMLASLERDKRPSRPAPDERKDYGYVAMAEAWQREVIQEAHRLGMLVRVDEDGIQWSSLSHADGALRYPNVETTRVNRAAAFIAGAKRIDFGAKDDGKSVVPVRDLLIHEICVWRGTQPEKGDPAL